MNSQDVVVDNSFNQVKESPAHHHAAQKSSSGPWHVSLFSSVKHQCDSQYCHYPSQGVKESIPEHIDFSVSQGQFWPYSSEHAMKLENLVEADPVEKPSHSDAEQGPCGYERFLVHKACPLAYEREVIAARLWSERNAMVGMRK